MNKIKKVKGRPIKSERLAHNSLPKPLKTPIIPTIIAASLADIPAKS